MEVCIENASFEKHDPLNTRSSKNQKNSSPIACSGQVGNFSHTISRNSLNTDLKRGTDSRWPNIGVRVLYLKGLYFTI